MKKFKFFKIKQFYYNSRTNLILQFPILEQLTFNKLSEKYEKNSDLNK